MRNFNFLRRLLPGVPASPRGKFMLGRATLCKSDAAKAMSLRVRFRKSPIRGLQSVP